MSFSRISHPFFVVGAPLLLASMATATPVTGKYNDKPGDGFAPPKGVYSVGHTAEFQRNGAGNPAAPGSGLAISGSTLQVTGGLFKDNKNFGIHTQARSQTIVNGGIFQDNTLGLLVNSRSHAVINGGNFANRTLNVWAANYSRVALKNGFFNCYGDLSNFGELNSSGELDKVAAGLVLSQRSFGIISGGTFVGYGSPISVGVYVLSDSSFIATNGRFINLIRGVNLYDAKNSIISGGTFGFYRSENVADFLNGSSGVFTCSSQLEVTGGTFTGNTDGLFATVHSGRSGTTVINGGNFNKNLKRGVSGLSSPSQTTRITINSGSFSGNGTTTFLDGDPNLDNYSGGAVFFNGTKALINDGRFKGNASTGVVALGPKSFVQINNGDFRSNGKAAYEGGPVFGRGAYIHSGAKALINDGNFSSNGIGVQIGLTLPPTDESLNPGGEATINGGVFHNEVYAVNAQTGSKCDITGGDFRAQASVHSRSFNGLTRPTRVRVFGGKFRSSQFDFLARSGSTIELTGVFDGYDNSRGSIVLPPGVGRLTGQLKLSDQRQNFSYRSEGNGRIILRPTNPPVSQSAPATSSAPTRVSTPAKSPSGASS
ncbi:MAG TPA: hypothetical protein VGB45_11030 [Abditibacterium sp.]